MAAELDEVLGCRTAPDPVDVGRLVVTRAALMEGMRLYPPAYAVDRTTTAPLRLAGHDVPAGTVLAVSPWSTHRHPDFWPDPERFDPSRFLGEHDRPRYAWFPFGGGPRGCVGEHFAMLEATILLGALLHRFSVTTVPGTLHVLPRVTLHPVGRVPATLSPADRHRSGRRRAVPSADRPGPVQPDRSRTHFVLRSRQIWRHPASFAEQPARSGPAATGRRGSYSRPPALSPTPSRAASQTGTKDSTISAAATTLTTGAWFGRNRLPKIQIGSVCTPGPR